VRSIRQSIKTGLLCDTQANHYIKYLNRDIKSSAVCLPNVYFTYVILKKSDAQIRQYLQSKHMQRKRVYYLPVYHNQHWFFVKVGMKEILICDSLRKRQAKYMSL
jgi:Ulp1 family protease